MIKTEIEKLKNLFYRSSTDKIAFRPVEVSDTYPLFEATKNEAFNKYLTWSAPSTVDELLVQIKKLKREDTLNNAVVLSIVEKVTGAWCGIMKWTPFENSYTLSLWLHPNYWNGFFSLPLIDASYQIMFLNTNVPDLHVLFDEHNNKSRRIMKFKNFNFIKKISQYNESNILLDLEHHSITRNDFKCNENIITLNI